MHKIVDLYHSYEPPQRVFRSGDTVSSRTKALNRYYLCVGGRTSIMKQIEDMREWDLDNGETKKSGTLAFRGKCNIFSGCSS